MPAMTHCSVVKDDFLVGGDGDDALFGGDGDFDHLQVVRVTTCWMAVQVGSQQ